MIVVYFLRKHIKIKDDKKISELPVNNVLEILRRMYTFARQATMSLHFRGKLFHFRVEPLPVMVSLANRKPLKPFHFEKATGKLPKCIHSH